MDDRTRKAGMRRGTIALVALGLLAAWAAARNMGARTDAVPADAPRALTQFGPYDAGTSLRQAFESLPADAHRTALTLVVENTDAWATRWRLLASARDSIDISYFILREDLFGAAFLGHLLKKAREGVRIRLLFDAQGTVMSFTSPRGNDWLDTLANLGNVDVKLFRPLLGRYVEALLTANPVALIASEHDKIMVIDRRRAMIGGRNLSAEYFADPLDLPTAFEDVDVILEGESAARLLIAAFETQYGSERARLVRRERVDLASYEEELTLAYRLMQAWLDATDVDAQTAARFAALGVSWRDDLARYPRLRGVLTRPPAPPDAKAETRLLDSPTRLELRADAIDEALRRLGQSARGRILIQSPYLVLAEETVERLAAIGARGVDVTILTNSPVSSDNALSQAFFLEQWPELLARVPRLRIFVTGQPRNLHAKLAVFDDQVTLIGTYNLEPMSMRANSEIMAAVWSRAFAQRAASRAQVLLARGPPSVYEYRIARDSAGRPVRDADGKPVVAFGPRDHAAPDEWRAVKLYWSALRTAQKVTGYLPLF